MSKDFYTIFNYLDEPRKYLGATLIEIIPVLLISLMGFTLDKIVPSLIIAVITFKIIRISIRSQKLKLVKRWILFQLQDLRLVRKASGRFYF